MLKLLKMLKTLVSEIQRGERAQETVQNTKRMVVQCAFQFWDLAKRRSIPACLKMLKMLQILKILIFHVFVDISLLQNVENVENCGSVNRGICPSHSELFRNVFNIFNISRQQHTPNAGLASEPISPPQIQKKMLKIMVFRVFHDFERQFTPKMLKMLKIDIERFVLHTLKFSETLSIF